MTDAVTYFFIKKKGNAMTWVIQEMAGADFGDARLNQRAIKLLDCFSSNPESTALHQFCRSKKRCNII